MKGMVWSVQLYIGFYGLEYSNYSNGFLLCGKGKENVDKKESRVPARKNMSHLLRLSRSGILWCNVSREEGEDPRRAIVRCIVSFRQVAMVKRDLQARRPSEISSNETCVSVVPDLQTSVPDCRSVTMMFKTVQKRILYCEIIGISTIAAAVPQGVNNPTF